MLGSNARNKEVAGLFVETEGMELAVNSIKCISHELEDPSTILASSVCFDKVVCRLINSMH